ncbi:MAG: winged helix-turn-helix domain-containing protein [Pseudomonadota bacterium]
MSKRKDQLDSLAARSRFWIADELHVQPDRLIVVRGNDEIRLEKRMMEVLVLLAENSGETITKERLLIKVWGSTVYGDSPVNKTVSLLRKLIKDDARQPRFIETIVKVGFKMIAPVTLPEDYRRMPAAPWTKGSPYVGLAAYDAAHKDVYCGRDQTVADLLRAMRNQIDNQRRFVMVVGASGCGKTSLLRAGAIPLVTKPDGFDGLRAISVATCDLASVPVGDPLTALAESLAGWTIKLSGTSESWPVFPPMTTAQLGSMLAEDPESIDSFVSEAFRRHSDAELSNKPHAHLLLIVDHAEALVGTADRHPDALAGFSRVLNGLCASERVLVVMVARGDFYLKLMEALPALADYKSGDGHLDVMAPRRGEITEIIRTPAWKADLTFETDPDSRDRLDDVLRDAATSQPDALPLLQHTLDILYESGKEQRLLTFAAYRAVGGLEGAIAHRAEEVFTALPEAPRNSLGEVLSRLTLPQTDNDAISACRSFADDLGRDACALVDAFVDARLLVADSADGRSTIGLVHEALLRRWPRAQEWIKENRRLLIAKARLQEGAKRWDNEGRNDDQLLNDGRQLEDAREAAKRFEADILDRDKEFILHSENQAIRKKKIKRTVIFILATTTLISLIMSSGLLITLQESRKSNKRAQESSDLVFRISDDLQKTGNGEALKSISDATLATMIISDESLKNADDLVNHSRVQTLKGSILFNRRKKKEALNAFILAHSAAKKAVALDPESSRAHVQAGRSAYWMGHYHYDETNYSAARVFWEEYRQENEILHNMEPTKYEWIVELSYAFDNLGSLSERVSDPASAIKNYRKSIELKNTALSLNPRNEELQYETIVTHSKIANILVVTGKLKEADYEYAKAIRDLDAIISRNESANEWKKQLSNLLQIKSRLSVLLGNLDASETEINRSIELLSEIIRQNPSHADWRQYLIMSNYDAAEVLRLKNDPRSRYHLDQVEHLAASYRNKEGLNFQLKRTLASARITRAIIDNSASSDAQLEIGISELRLLFQQRPDDIHTAIALAKGMIARGDRHSLRGESEDSAALWREAKTALDLLGQRGSDPRVAGVWTIASERIGEYQLSQGKRIFLTEINYRHPDFVASPRHSSTTTFSR